MKFNQVSSFFRSILGISLLCFSSFGAVRVETRRLNPVLDKMRTLVSKNPNRVQPHLLDPTNKQGPRFEITEEIIEPLSSDNSVKIHLFKGYFRSKPTSPKIYFEYSLPENYSGIDVSESAGYTKDSSFWDEPNKRAGFSKHGMGILTFDGWVRGRTLSAIPKSSAGHPDQMPDVVTTRAEAKLKFELVKALGLNDIVGIGHSRGAGIEARFLQLIVRQNKLAEPSDKINIISHTDTNGLVSYVSQSFPTHIMGTDSSMTAGYYRRTIIRHNTEPEIADVRGEFEKVELKTPEMYHKELMRQWTEFEGEFMENFTNYRKMFFTKEPQFNDVWDPHMRDLSEDEYTAIQRKYSLIIEPFATTQTAMENLAIDLMADKSLTDRDEQDRDIDGLRAMMKGLRTAFSYNGHKYFIPHTILPSLVELAQEGIPIKVIYSPHDKMVSSEHAKIKRSALQSYGSVEVIKDDSTHDLNNAHYGPNREIWEKRIVPKIVDRVQVYRCQKYYN